MRYIAFAALCLAFVLAGCRKAPAPSASASPTPTETSSTAQVVQVFAHLVPSSETPGSVELVISPGFHVNANPATFPYLIATEVQPGQVDGVTVSNKITYPAGVLKKFQFADEPLSVYEGRVIIPIPFKITKPSTTPRLLPIKVRVQACDEEKCFPPATLTASLPVDPGVRR